MARNKYPEVTVERILEVSRRLFLEKGYENTTIQDIVDELDGLTKGAVYHHFKSKDEIMDAVSDRMFFANNPFEAVRGRFDLNGLQKLKEMLRLLLADTACIEMDIQSIPIARNPRVLVEMIRANRRILTPCFLELIEEGNRDGSIRTDYAREIAELLPLLISLWLLPSAFPATKEEMGHKFQFLGDMLEKMGVPAADEELMKLADEFAAKISAESDKE